MNVKRTAGILVFLAAIGPLRANIDSDLNRLTPVPGNAQIPVVDFFRTPLLQTPEINFTGTAVAALLAASGDHTGLFVYDLGTHKTETVGTPGEFDIADLNWLDGKTILYSVTRRKAETVALLRVDAGSLGSPRPMLQFVPFSVLAVPPKDRIHPLVTISADSMNTGHYDVVTTIDTSLESGKLVAFEPNVTDAQMNDSKDTNQQHIIKRFPELKTNHGFNLRFIPDKEGQLAFGITQENGVLALHKLAGDTWVKCPEDLDEIDVIGAGDQPGEIVVLGPRQEGKARQLEFMDAETGTVRAPLLTKETYDFSGWLYRDPVNHMIVGTVYDRDGPHVEWLRDEFFNLQKAVDRMFPGQIVRILGTDDAEKTVLISSFSDRQPEKFSWVDLEKHSVNLIMDSRPWIDPARMLPMHIFKYKTGDGRRLDAYVTLPVGASKDHPAPLVVLPHGDSDARSSWGFDPEAQFLASRGYAVLQPNYRGSAGYTGLFPEGDRWAYLKMHEDVTSALKTLLSTGVVDRNRVAIVGTWIGGYLALAGAAFEPSLYKCAVAVSPVSDWANYLDENSYDQFMNAEHSRLLYKLGDPKRDAEKFDAMSPLKHANQVRVPVLITMGEYDASGQRQAKGMISALESNHIPVESIVFPKDYRWVNYLNNKVELYTRIEAFLAKSLGPNAPAPGAN